jgi:hypothetical protein
MGASGATHIEALVIYLTTAMPAMSDAVRVTYELLLTLAQGQGSPMTPAMTLPELAGLRARSVRTVQRHLRALVTLSLIQEESAARTAAPRDGAQAPVTPPVPGARVWWLQHAPVAPAAATADAPPLPPYAPAVSAMLQRAGVYQGVAQKLARSPWLTPDLAAAWERHLRADRRVRNLAAMLTYTLEAPERCLPLPVAPLRDEQGGRAGPSPGVVRRPRRVSVETRHAWRRALSLLSPRLGARAMHLGLAASQPVAYDGRVLVVAVPTASSAELLALEHGAALNAAAREAWGKAVQVRLTPAREGQLVALRANGSPPEAPKPREG